MMELFLRSDWRSIGQTFAILGLAVVALTNIGYAQTNSNGTSQVGQPVFLNKSFVIPPSEMSDLERQALEGSGDAAMRLGSYYYVIKIDEARGQYWMTIAAENGSPNAMYNLGFRLRLSSDTQDVVRARFWLEKAVQANASPASSLASSLLQEMDRQQTNKPQ